MNSPVYIYFFLFLSLPTIAERFMSAAAATLAAPANFIRFLFRLFIPGAYTARSLNILSGSPWDYRRAPNNTRKLHRDSFLFRFVRCFFPTG